MQGEEQLSFSDRLADKVARFGGSWRAIIICVVGIVVWISVNTWVLLSPVDPYPYILLNLLLSCVAALQAPFILMASNRQQARDSAHLKADLEIDTRTELTINMIVERLQRIQTKLDQLP